MDGRVRCCCPASLRKRVGGEAEVPQPAGSASFKNIRLVFNGMWDSRGEGDEGGAFGDARMPGKD